MKKEYVFLDLKDYKIRVTNDTSDTGLNNYITFIV